MRSPLPDPIELGPAAILDGFEERRKGFKARNEQYETFLSYYHGRQGMTGAQGVKAMDSKGRPLLRYLGSAWETYQRKVVSNRVQPIVDDYQALLGRVPEVRVDAPGDTPDDQEKAALLTKYLMSTYELSEIALQQQDAGFYLSLLGDTCYALDVDTDLWRVVITVINPAAAFPSFLKGYKRTSLYDLYIGEELTEDEIKQNYGITVTSSDPLDRTVITYLSPWQRSVMVGREQVAHVMHNMGWCPARWHFNKLLNGTQATSDIAQILSWQDYYNFALNVSADGLVEMTYPIRHLVNPQAFGEDQLEIGPGSTVVSDETGKINLVAPTPKPDAALALMDLGTREMMMGAGTTPVRMEGDMHSSIQTGRAIHAIQGPQATRIDLKQLSLSFTFTRLNAMVLEMQEKAPFLKGRTFEIWGRDKGKEFRQQMSSADIGGWYQNTVTWDAMIGISDQQKMVMAMQGQAAMLFDDIKGREMMGIDDPVGMRERIASWKKWEAGLQQQVAGAGNPPAPGMSPTPMSPMPGGAPPAQGGGGNPPPPPEMVFRPRELASRPTPQGMPQGTTLTQIQTAMQGIASQLKGEVWASGDLVQQGVSMKPQLWLTEYKDYRIVSRELTTIMQTFTLKAVKSDESIPDPKQRIA